jgi:hypothetical protein
VMAVAKARLTAPTPLQVIRPLPRSRRRRRRRGARLRLQLLTR